MATETFDRPLVLSEEGSEKFLEIASRPAKPDNIKPFHEIDRREADELLKKYWFKDNLNI